jgi:hypothetical protein
MGSLVQAQLTRTGARGKRVSGMWLKLHIFHRHQSTGCAANLINQIQRYRYVYMLDWVLFVLLLSLCLLFDWFAPEHGYSDTCGCERSNVLLGVSLLFDCFTSRHGFTDTWGCERSNVLLRVSLLFDCFTSRHGYADTWGCERSNVLLRVGLLFDCFTSRHGFTDTWGCEKTPCNCEWNGSYNILRTEQKAETKRLSGYFQHSNIEITNK